MKRNNSYLLFIRSRPCCVCGDLAEPHHQKCKRIVPCKYRGGIGLKSADETCIPLCRLHHNEIEAGVERFENKHNINLSMKIIELLIDYIHEKVIK